MRVLVVGGGGREHALVRAFAASPLCSQLFCAPGNAGIAAEAECVPIGADDIAALLEFAQKESIDLTVVGPEAPLVAGIADLFIEHGLKVFGPNKVAAQLEGSKFFAKQIMAAAGVPTGAFARFTDADEAQAYLDTQRSWPLVVKADGLAAGKGVTICNDRDEARAAVTSCLIDNDFGEAGNVVLVEEFLGGSEVSLLALCDGATVVPMAPAQDYKRIFNGDQGPNTGGMGSYCPVPGFSDETAQRICDEVYQPVLDALRARGVDFRGVLYGGLIATEQGINLLEFNCRFGDPETQVVLPRLESDLVEICLACAGGRLAPEQVRWKPDAAVTVVLASGGYPGSYAKGKVIVGLDEAALTPGVLIFHAGTRWENGRLLTSGGRVLNVTALAPTLEEARKRAYEAVSKIHFEGMHFRKDIAKAR